MNKRRETKQKRSLSTFEVVLLLLAAMIVMAGGVNYAILKNKQVALDRQIDKVYRSVKVHEMESSSIMVEIKRKVNRFAMASVLREQGSSMSERPNEVVEKVSFGGNSIVSVDRKVENVGAVVALD